MRYTLAAVMMAFSLSSSCCGLAFQGGAQPRQFQLEGLTHRALFSEHLPSELLLQDMFTSFMHQYSKVYSHEEFFSRYLQFKNNVEIIRLHNTLTNSSYTMGLNQFADLSFEEFKAKYFGYNHRERENSRTNNLHQEIKEAPPAIDWRNSKAVTPVKHQGACGSDWAFSATGAIEGAWVLQAHHDLVSLSEQQLVDCSVYNEGCNGGSMDFAFDYVISKKGICTESDYPYTGVRSPLCKSGCSRVVTISGHQPIKEGSESALLNAVGTIGPVSVGVEADQNGFQFYKSGIFDGVCGTRLDHGVLAVGYGTEGGKDYWIVKNSWGTSWGESGYIRLIRGRNQCGIALEASYPTV